jgi:hypothetical protein
MTESRRGSRHACYGPRTSRADRQGNCATSPGLFHVPNGRQFRAWAIGGDRAPDGASPISAAGHGTVIIFTGGLPGPVQALSLAIIRGLISRCLSPSLIEIASDTLDPILPALLETRAHHAVVCTHIPSVELRMEIVKSGSPLLICEDEPGWTVFDLTRNPEINFIHAVRIVANVVASVFDVSFPGVLAIRPEDFRRPHETFRRFAAWLGLQPSDDDLRLLAKDPVIEALIASFPTRVRSGWEPSFSDTEQKVIRGATDAYLPKAEGAVLGEIVWRRELFLMGDDATQAPLQALDVTGRARLIIYGPYVRLPPGSWLGRLYIGFSASAVGLRFDIEARAGPLQLILTSIEPKTEGVFEIFLRFNVPSTNDPVEVRLFSSTAAFDGKLALGHVVLSREDVRLDPVVSDLLLGIDIKS